MTTSIVPDSTLLDNLLDDTPAEDLHKLFALVLERVMQYDIANRTGAARYERSESRTNQRNGTGPRRFDTRLGTSTVARVAPIEQESEARTELMAPIAQTRRGKTVKTLIPASSAIQLGAFSECP